MVSCKTMGCGGRLGNQMFALAATIGYARKQSTPYIIPAWIYAQCFEGEFNQSLNVPEYQVYREPNFHYDEIPQIHDVDLLGYFQAIKYWEHCEDEIRNMFTFIKWWKDRIIDEWKDVLEKKPVAIHVRRGDYLNLSDYLPVLPLKYYEEAMKAFPEGTTFVIFTDDYLWCKENFLGPNLVFAAGNEISDLCFMTMCTGGHIIANSSYSWWGAYLANSPKVVAPLNWFGPKANHNTKDLYLPNWILIGL